MKTSNNNNTATNNVNNTIVSFSSLKANLKEVDKEVKSLSGVIKVISTFWGNKKTFGYKDAFSGLGFTKETFTFEAINALLKSNEIVYRVPQETDKDGNELTEKCICIQRKVYFKDEDGNNVLTEDGKRYFEFKFKTVKAFTPAILFDLICNVRYAEMNDSEKAIAVPTKEVKETKKATKETKEVKEAKEVAKKDVSTKVTEKEALIKKEKEIKANNDAIKEKQIAAKKEAELKAKRQESAKKAAETRAKNKAAKEAKAA